MEKKKHCGSCTFSASILHLRTVLSTCILRAVLSIDLATWSCKSSSRAENKRTAVGVIFPGTATITYHRHNPTCVKSAARIMNSNICVEPLMQSTTENLNRTRTLQMQMFMTKTNNFGKQALRLTRRFAVRNLLCLFAAHCAQILEIYQRGNSQTAKS